MTVTRRDPQLRTIGDSAIAHPSAAKTQFRLADKGYEMRTNRTVKRPALATVEAALVLPLLFILLFGVWEVSRMLDVCQVVSNSAREGARQASAGLPASNVNIPAGKTSYGVQNFVAMYLMNSGLPAPINRPFTVTVTDLTATGQPSCSCTFIYSAGSSSAYNLQLTQIGTAPSVDPVLNAARNDVLSVQVTYPYDEARLSPVNLYVFFGTWDLSDTAYWPCMIDVPITINASIPSQPQ
jgi:Flp pilus assembly protein TadG